MFQDNQSTPLGRFLRDTRLSAGLSLHAFGQLIGGFSKTMVSRWERGINVPSIKNLHQIAEHLNIDVKNLIALKEAANSIDDNPNELFHLVAQSDNLTYKGVRLDKDEIATIRAMLEVITKNKHEKN